MGEHSVVFMMISFIRSVLYSVESKQCPAETIDDPQLDPSMGRTHNESGNGCLGYYSKLSALTNLSQRRPHPL